MYVIYPLICYNAAHAWKSFSCVFNFIIDGIKLRPALRRSLKSFVLWGVFLTYVTLSAARVLAQVRGYRAHMQVFTSVENSSTVCLGKEWYRFPSSFFIPETSRALFVKSAFDGLLPGRFPEGNELGWRGGISKVPEKMNDQNQEELSHLVQSVPSSSLIWKVPVELCDYIVDSDFPLHYREDNAIESQLEPRYTIMSSIWSRIDCRPFLDALNSGVFGRSFWLPIRALDRAVWGELCLLKRRL